MTGPSTRKRNLKGRYNTNGACYWSRTRPWGLKFQKVWHRPFGCISVWSQRCTWRYTQLVGCRHSLGGRTGTRFWLYWQEFGRRLWDLKMPCEYSYLTELSFWLFCPPGVSWLLFSEIIFLVTSTAKMTAELVIRPTEQRPFFTASIAYYTWKRCPLGEKTVIAVSYI